MNAGGTLNVTSILTLADATGIDLDCSGTLNITGEIDGSGQASVAQGGTFAWTSGGKITTITLTIENNVSATINGNVVLNGPCNFINKDVSPGINWSNGTINTNSVPAFTNNGTLNLLTDVAYGGQYGCTFTNGFALLPTP